MSAKKRRASAATDPGNGSIISLEKNMNVETNTIESAPVATPTLSQLINKAERIAHQLQISEDTNEFEDLVIDLAEVDNRIIEFRVRTMADVRRKARHLVTMLDTGLDPLDGACLAPLLRSLAGRAVA